MFDRDTIAIPCECGRKTTKTIRWLKMHRQFTFRCACGIGHRVDARKLIREVASVERAERRFRKRIERGL